MPHHKAVAIALALLLSTAAPALAHDSGYHNGPIVLQSAHPDLGQGTLTLRGDFGTRSVTVWLGETRLDLIRQTAHEVTVGLPHDLANGTYDVVVARGRLTGQYDTLAVYFGNSGGYGTPGPRGPAG